MIHAKTITEFCQLKIKGGALLFALVISFLILLTVSSIITINYYYTIRCEYSVQLSRLNSNIESAITLALNSPSTERTETNDLIDLFGNGRDTVHLQTWSFGLLKGFNLSGTYKQVRMQRRALTADELGNRSVLFIADHGREISMAGKTELYGKVDLPKAGYSASSLAGSFLIGNPIKGMKGNSTAYLPEFNKDLATAIEDALENKEHDSTLTSENFMDSDTIKNSFSNKTIFVALNGKHTLRNKYIEGNVIIRSTGKLAINSSCVIKDAVIIAPSLELEDECTFSGQLLASDSVITGKDCMLNYPSIIAVRQKKNTPGFVGIGRGNQFTGTIIGLRDKETINIPFGLNIGEMSITNGQIYFQGPAALSGEMNGEFYFDYVMSNTTSSVNNNFLFNVVANQNKLNESLCFLPITEEKRDNSKKAILKWIY